MIVAIPFEDNMVFQHFGHTPAFKFYKIEDGVVTDAAVISTQSSGHGALAGLLKQCMVDAIICGGIGPGAVNALESIGIAVYAGVTGEADTAIISFVNGSLDAVGNFTCSHHGEGHSCSDHGCSDHGCSGHSCSDHGCC